MTRTALAKREREVLELIASGFTRPQIAAELGIERSTVREYVDRIRAVYRAQGREAASIAILTRRAIEDGIVAPIEMTEVPVPQSPDIRR